jgi:hypothetical protein
MNTLGEFYFWTLTPMFLVGGITVAVAYKMSLKSKGTTGGIKESGTVNA